MKSALVLLGLVGVAVAMRQPASADIKKVVELLQGMRTKVQKQIKQEAADWEEYGEWFRKTKQETEYDLKDSTDDLERAQACASDAAAKTQEYTSKIADLAKSITEDSEEADKATKVRAEEKADFEKSQMELVDAVDTLVRAAVIIRKATGGAGSGSSAAAFKSAMLQVAGTLSTIMDAAYVSVDDRAKLQSLLQSQKKDDKDDDDDDKPSGYAQPTAAAYESHAGNIIDVLAGLKEKAEAELNTLRKDEMNKQHNFDMLHQKLTDSVNVADSDKKNAAHRVEEEKEVDSKCSGEAVEQTAEKKKAEETLAHITSAHEEKTTDRDTIVKDRQHELESVSKAIEILSHEKFTKAVHGAFMQTKGEPGIRDELASLLKKTAARLGSVELAQLAVRATEDPFSKVKDLIKTLITKLQKQGAEEVEHKAWCDQQTKENKAKREDESQKLETYSARLERAQADSAQLKEDVAKLSGEIAEMDASLDKATEIRQKESQASAIALQDSNAGLEGLSRAISVLKNYFGSSANKSDQGDSGKGVVAFLEVAQGDMIKQKSENESTEKKQADAFDKLKDDTQVSRAQKEAARKGKEAESTRLAASIQDLKNDKESTSDALDATMKYLERLHSSCTHKVMSFKDRAKKMTEEIDSLHQALEILDNDSAGSEASFLQRRG